MIFVSSVIAGPQKKAVRNQVGEESVQATTLSHRSGLVETIILSEDFSKFTAGSESEPDNMRLDDPQTTDIDNAYFNSPGWSGIEIYQAGGCAYIDFSDEWGEPGLLSTPLINTEGSIFIKCRMKAENHEGEIVGYNIVDQNWELIDSNVDFVEVTDEWTEVSWFTSSGCENSYIYFFSYSTNIFIDDIEVISCSMPTPALLDETDITKNAFTANWETVDAADAYIFRLFADHSITEDDTFYYTNTDFSSIVSEGTISLPESVSEWSMNVDGWHIYMPTLINEAIGVTGRFSSLEQYGTLTSPISDFSSDNGKVNISFKAYGKVGDEIFVNLLTPAQGYYDIACQKKLTIEKEGWVEYSETLTNGMEESYIDISYFGLNDIFFDDLKLYQSVKKGEKKTTTIYNEYIEETSFRAKIEDKYLNDRLYYQVASTQYVYTPDGSSEIGSIDSEFTPVRDITLNDNPQGSETIAIGEGSLNTSYAPISNYGNAAQFSISQQIYTKEEINKDNGLITSISFHNNNGNSNTRDIIVYMNNVSKKSYESNKDWVLVDDNDIVYEFEFTFGDTGEWTTIELEKPFAYTGEDLAITVYDRTGDTLGYSGLHDTFFASATDTLRGLYKTSSTNINLDFLDELYGYELKTSIYSEPQNQYYVANIKLNIEAMEEIAYPSVPQHLSANLVEANTASLSWTSAKNATSYNVYCGTEKIATVTETFYLAENLDYETEYCYTVSAVNDELESDKSATACVKTSVDGINELGLSFNIYPNPVKDEIRITSEEIIEQVTIYSIDGRKIYNKQGNNVQSTINVANLSPGTYFIKVNGIVNKFVKK